MSTFSSASYINSKGSEPFVSELTADWFEQYLNFNPSEATEPINLTLPETICLDSPGGENYYQETSSGSSQGEAMQSSIESSWNCEQWANHDPASFRSVKRGDNEFHNQSSGQTTVSDLDLMKFAKLSIDLPEPRQDHDLSPPPSPSPNPGTVSRRKNFFVDTISRKLRKATSSLDIRMRGPIRKPAVLPQLMRTSNKTQYELEPQPQLAFDAAQFDFGFETPAPLTPPKPSRIPNALQTQHSVQGFGPISSGQFDMPNHYATPVGTPALEHHSFRDTCSLRTPSNRSLYPQTPQFRHTSASFSPFVESPALDDFGSVGLYGDMDSTSWWNSPSNTTPLHPSPIPFRLNTQQSTKTIDHQLQNNLAVDMNELHYDMNDMGYNMPCMPSGLMIEMPETPSQQSSIVISSSFPSPQDFYPPHPPKPQRQPQYSPSPSGRGRSLQNYATAPRGRHASLSVPKSRSRSSGSELSSADSPSTFDIRKQRKSSRSCKVSLTPGTVTFGTAGDFVNYTPKDGRTILKGVAPSGSSKTKARREQEALEKRRKLSRAAVRVVLAAGGDVGKLVEEGVLE